MADLLAWGDNRPLFTINEAERATGMNRASLREKLSRMTRRGELRRLERGKYTCHSDPVIYATYIEIPSYLSFWSGLRFYDLTTQQPTQIQVVTPTNRGNLEEITFYYSGDMFGFGRKRYAGFDVFVADEERLLLNCLSRKQVPVAALGELLNVVDTNKATEYALRLGRNSVKKRLGYLFEHKRDTSVKELRVTDRNYPVLDLTRGRDGEPNARWRLKVNADVI